MAQLPTGIVTHSQKVCSLYKRALLCLRDWSIDRLDWRIAVYGTRYEVVDTEVQDATKYEAVKLRKRFDENARIPDLRLAKHLLLQGEEELFQKQHPQPMKFPDSIGGVAHERDLPIPDSLLDHWDPMEKAMYPKYFALREQRKKEYMEWYYKEYPEKKLEGEKSH